MRKHFGWALQLHPAFLALLLPIGAVIAIAVAWGGALCCNLAHGTPLELYAELAGGHHWEVYRWDSAIGTRVLSSCWLGEAEGPFNHGDPARLLPVWSSVASPDAAAPRVRADVQDGWGFPFRSLGCRSVIQSEGGAPETTTTSPVIRLRNPKNVGEGGVYLPLDPLWAGLALNSLVYGLVAMVGVAVTRDLKRAYGRRAAAAG